MTNRMLGAVKEFFKRFFRDFKNGDMGAACFSYDLLTIIFLIGVLIVTLVRRFLF